MIELEFCNRCRDKCPGTRRDRSYIQKKCKSKTIQLDLILRKREKKFMRFDDLCCKILSCFRHA